MAFSTNTEYSDFIISSGYIQSNLYTANQTYLGIYKGAQPTGPITNWPTVKSSRSSDLLVEIEDASSFGFSLQLSGKSIIYSTGDPPAATNATATGTAAWGALQTTVNGAIVTIGSCTLSSGNGLFFLDSLSITSGNPVTTTGFKLTFA